MNELYSALQYVDYDDRETWVLMAMAVKSELGRDGFSMWDAWSQLSKKYRADSARSVWKSVRPTGGITVGTLYKFARDGGWRGTEPPRRPRPAAFDPREDEAATRHAAAAVWATSVVADCVEDHHPYLDLKGFPEETGLIHYDGRLVIPMRSCVDYSRIQSVQYITGTGQKKFLKNGEASGAVYFVGAATSAGDWLCEGYATGLSLKAALRQMGSHQRVVVCFSAGNIPKVAKLLSNPYAVMADNDAATKRAGEKFAQRTGLPWVMPPANEDANDLHQKDGLFAVCRLIAGMKHGGY